MILNPMVVVILSICLYIYLELNKIKHIANTELIMIHPIISNGGNIFLPLTE